MIFRHEMPFAVAGQRIGLLGGSFDPPHQGHVNLSLWALKRFSLDRIWWIVSPGNPLKPRPPAPLALRMAAARALIHHPRILVTDIEARLGTRYTAKTLEKLRAHYPAVRFTWLMGADNLASFHEWERWRDICDMVPIGVLARPGSRMAARRSKAAITCARYRLPPEAAPLLSACRPPAWCMINMPMIDLSSTCLRTSGLWPFSENIDA